MKNQFGIFLMSVFLSCTSLNTQIIEDIDPQELYSAVKDPAAILLDVRTPQEFSSGHISGATNLDFYSEDFIDKLSMINQDAPIYIYCKSGGRSSSTASKMKDLGFKKIYNLKGGVLAWNRLNYTTVKSEKLNKNISQRILSEIELNKILNTNRSVLINFSTEWCVPCRKMKPIVIDIQNEYTDVKVLLIDADANKRLVNKYNIDGIPVFIIFKNGKEIFRHIGLITKEELIKELI